jgi:asparagine N-glycosylation enzyme membrane subunit Stt3
VIKIYKALILIVAILVISGCSSSNTHIPKQDDTIIATKDEMIGKWYGVHTYSDGTKRAHLINRYKDNRYKIEFISYYKDGDIYEYIEMGEWKIEDNLYYTTQKSFVANNIVESANINDANNYDLYKVIKSTDKIFVYKYLKTGKVYTIRKVPDSFSLDKI